EITPALAESWIRSKNGLTYTFRLRKDAKWTDGVPLKAEDFVYSWRRLLDPKTAASYAYLLFDISGAEGFNRGTSTDPASVGVRALDDQTLEVKLARPTAHWLHIPTFWVTYPMRRDVVEKHGSSWDQPGKIITIGPFTLAAREPDQKIVMKSYEGYYKKRRGNISEAVGLIIKEDSTALGLYETGKLDFMTDIPPMEISRLSSSPDYRVFPYLKTVYLGFVIDRFPVDQLEARRAIAQAIDKSLFGKVLAGGQEAAPAWLPPSLILGGQQAAYSPPFDQAKAKAAFASLTFEPDRPVNWELVFLNAEKTMTAAQFIQAELKKTLGIELKLQPYDNKTFRKQVDLKVAPMFLLSWSADYPDADNFMSVFLKDSGNNRTNWSHRGFDERVLGARSLSQPLARGKLYAEASKFILADDIVIVPLYHEPNLTLIRPRVRNFALDPLNY
ncbi:MAG: peptide ABC transporter substrate-binding protein, partial [Bdellovibrionota bacterium]